MSSKAATKFSWQNVVAEIRNPTNGGSRFIKYSVIAISIGLAYWKGLKPALQELQFRREEEFAHTLFEMEQKQQQQQQSS